MMTNCPNCGAVISYDGGMHCDYCGTRFERPSADSCEIVLRVWGCEPCHKITIPNVQVRPI